MPGSLPRQPPLAEGATAGGSHPLSHAWLITWDPHHNRVRVGSSEPSSPTAADATCLWCAGWVANRPALSARTGLPLTATARELVPALYAREGPEAARQIAGDLAWVLWDPRQRLLFACRDRLGSHRLLYRVVADQILLSGSVGPLLSDPLVPGPGSTINLSALVAHVQGDALPPGETFFSSIQAVEPATCVTFGGTAEIRRRYFCLAAQPLLELHSDAEYAEAFRDRLREVVADHAEPGPLGLTLSSGLDSTSIAVALSELGRASDVTAITWVTPGLPAADESAGARAVVSRTGLGHLEIPADRHWPLATGMELEPPAEGPPLTLFGGLWDVTYALARERRISSLWTGLGGDHLFGGNVFSYPDLLLTGRWLALARQLRDHLPRSEFRPAEVLRSMIVSPILRSYMPLPRFRRVPTVPWLTAKGLALYRPQRPTAPRRLLPGRRQRFEALTEAALPRLVEDQAAAAARHGVTLRHPLLDPRLLELAASLPTDQSFRAARRKGIMVRAMRGRLPDEILDRHDKIYPTALAERGLKERETKKVWSLMDNPRLGDLGLIEPASWRQAYRLYLDGREDSDMFWHTLTAEAWLRLHGG